MTPRERVIAAINHKEPDKLPLDLGRAYLLSSDSWKDWTLPDGTPCKIPVWFEPVRENDRWVFKHRDGTVFAEMRPGMLYFDQTYFPLAGKEETEFEKLEQALEQAMEYVMWSALACPPWHQVSTDEDYKRLREVARKLYEETDYAIMVEYGGNLMEWGQFLCGIENFLTDLAWNKRRVEALLDKLVEHHLAGLDKFLDAVGDYVQIIQFGDDLGMQQGPQISPNMYREIFKPRHTMIYQAAKKLCNAAIFLHSCGGIYELIPDLIETGVDILNPVQTSAVNMEPEKLKKEFGDALTFWGGGCDTQTVLPRSTPEKIKEHVRSRIESFAPGGGFVFTQVHNIQSDVPPENIVAMFEAVQEYR